MNFIRILRTFTGKFLSCLQRIGSNPRWKMSDPQLWRHTNAPFAGFRVVKPVNQPGSVEEMEKYWIEAIQDYH